MTNILSNHLNIVSLDYKTPNVIESILLIQFFYQSDTFLKKLKDSLDINKAKILFESAANFSLNEIKKNKIYLTKKTVKEIS